MIGSKLPAPIRRASDHGVSEAIYLRHLTRTASSFIGIGRRKNGAHIEWGAALVAHRALLNE
jgi:hypothetical protein